MINKTNVGFFVNVVSVISDQGEKGEPPCESCDGAHTDFLHIGME